MPSSICLRRALAVCIASLSVVDVRALTLQLRTGRIASGAGGVRGLGERGGSRDLVHRHGQKDLSRRASLVEAA